MKTATDDQIETIRKRAYNQEARNMQHEGVKLSWEQADDLGDQAIDWMRSRLGLKSSTSDRGITFNPDVQLFSPSHSTKRRNKTITVTMDRPGWDEQHVTHRVLADVEEPCGVTQIDDVTFEIECARTREVLGALNTHPAVKSYEIDGARKSSAKRSHATKANAGVTDTQIRALRREAASAGDHAQVLLCDLALGDVVLDEDTPLDSLRVARFLSLRDKRRISAMDPDDYRAACERAIEAGRG